MFKKTLTALVAALTLTSATLATTQSAQAGFGKFIAAGIVGAAVGAVVAGSARSQEPSFRPARGGFDDGCGFRTRPVFDEFGHQVGARRVPAC